MKYYKANVYLKEKPETLLGTVVIQDRETHGIEISTKLEIDICHSLRKIKPNKKTIDRLGYDVYIKDTEIDTEHPIDNSKALNEYLEQVGKPDFCLNSEIIRAKLKQKK